MFIFRKAISWLEQSLVKYKLIDIVNISLGNFNIDHLLNNGKLLKRSILSINNQKFILVFIK